ncbi:MAG: NAD(P)-dependent oxidoreductase [Syntrophales bacterium]|jgi:D-3-phosphoglycerate dehydrogenase|nr:NAD(P)-dependent oxidoreductase [Syntrophales bacterium]
MKVVIIGDFTEGARKRIAARFPSDWKVAVVAAGDAEPELADAEVIVPEHVAVDGPFLDRAPKLRLVQTGAGFDNVDVSECTKRGIHAANAAGVNTVAVAEHVLTLLLCRYKDILHLDAAMKRGEYGVDYNGSEAAGKVLGIVGMGNIGKAVAKRALAFEMQILGYDIRPVTDEPGIEMTDLDTLLKTADAVTLHTFLNDRTRKLIGRREFALMKPDSFLINTSRGPVIDEEALIEALQTGRIAGAGLDVFEKEPLPKDSPLRRMRNVILTPHTAGMPDGLKYHERRYAFFLENILRVSQGKEPLSALNRISAL